MKKHLNHDNKKIICIFKSGRNLRFELVNKGKAPREFFYGFFELIEKGYNVVRISNSFKPKNIFGYFLRYFEIFFNQFHKLGLNPSVIYQNFNKFKHSNTIISFTDGLSITLGYYRKTFKNEDQYLIGCFHCLSDFDNRSPKILQFWSDFVINKSLKNLDHVAFFGPADRIYALQKFNLNKNKTSIIKFGVDTKFWVPSRKKQSDYIFSVGQDPNRDFLTLMKVNINYPIKIHTALNIKKPKNRHNIEISKGSFNKSTISDIELRKIYQNSAIVVIPLKDVYQPTGYSVTLQAMACGKPVILTKIKGLWSSKLLINKFNCILVPPYDHKSLEDAINNLLINKKLRDKISYNARKTVLEHFNLKIASNSLEKIILRSFR